MDVVVVRGVSVPTKSKLESNRIFFLSTYFSPSLSRALSLSAALDIRWPTRNELDSVDTRTKCVNNKSRSK